MNEIVIVRPDKCIGCLACVRACPASEANSIQKIDDNRIITAVDSSKCIACGECIKSCRHGARDYVDDTNACMANLENEKMIILATPAIKTALPRQWKDVLDWFKKKGCIVYDVSLGADICTWAHVRALENGEIRKTISQPCAAVVNYAQIYQPRLLKNMSPIHSPIGCAAVYIKNYLRRKNPIAVISPCVAKKVEFGETGLVDYNVTIRKLMEYFERNDIVFNSTAYTDNDYEFEDQQGQLGSVYPRPGGLRDNIWQRNPNINIINSEGVHKVYPELEMYVTLPDSHLPDVFDVLSCEYGCNVGVGADAKQNAFDLLSSMKIIENEAKEKMKNKGTFRTTSDDKLFKYFDESLNPMDFRRGYRPAKPSKQPSDKELEPVFESMGKLTDASRHYDCHACGYKSCREMATAIYRGLNSPDNCTIHNKEVLMSRHSELTGQHERLEQITNSCLELSEKVSHDMLEIKNSMDAIGKSNGKTSERATVVNELLKNVVQFCQDNSTMDSDTVEQLIMILQKVIKAFGILDDNVNVTSKNSETINNSIGTINGLIAELNETLHKTVEVDQK